MAAMLEQQMKWETYMNRQQQGFAVSNGLLALVEQLSGMPGRKTVVLLSEGFEVPDNVRKKFNEVEDRANRHNVTFYTMDAAGLRVHSRMPRIAAMVGQAGEQNFATGIASDPTGDRTEMMWRDPTAGLEPLARHTGGLYIGDTNNLKEGFAKVSADRRFYYLLAYASSNPALDGTYRKIDVRVRRPDVKVRARGGYVASPSIEETPRGDYESAAAAVLDASPPAAAFPFQLRAISTPLDGKPGLISLVAAVETGVMTFRENPSARTYDGEVTVLARVRSRDGAELVTQSQLYQMHGKLDDLEAARRGRLLFFRTPVVPPGTHTVEWVVRDGTSGEASVLRSAMDVPLPDVQPVVGDLVIIDHAEKAPAGRSGDEAPPARLERHAAVSKPRTAHQQGRSQRADVLPADAGGFGRAGAVDPDGAAARRAVARTPSTCRRPRPTTTASGRWANCPSTNCRRACMN